MLSKYKLVDIETKRFDYCVFFDSLRDRASYPFFFVNSILFTSFTVMRMQRRIQGGGGRIFAPPDRFRGAIAPPPEISE